MREKRGQGWLISLSCFYFPVLSSFLLLDSFSFFPFLSSPFLSSPFLPYLLRSFPPHSHSSQPCSLSLLLFVFRATLVSLDQESLNDSPLHSGSRPCQWSALAPSHSSPRLPTLPHPRVKKSLSQQRGIHTSREILLSRRYLSNQGLTESAFSFFLLFSRISRTSKKN